MSAKKENIRRFSIAFTAMLLFPIYLVVIFFIYLPLRLNTLDNYYAWIYGILVSLIFVMAGAIIKTKYEKKFMKKAQKS